MIPFRDFVHKLKARCLIIACKEFFWRKSTLMTTQSNWTWSHRNIINVARLDSNAHSWVASTIDRHILQCILQDTYMLIYDSLAMSIVCKSPLITLYTGTSLFASTDLHNKRVCSIKIAPLYEIIVQLLNMNIPEKVANFSWGAEPMIFRKKQYARVFEMICYGYYGYYGFLQLNRVIRVRRQSLPVYCCLPGCDYDVIDNSVNSNEVDSAGSFRLFWESASQRTSSKLKQTIQRILHDLIHCRNIRLHLGCVPDLCVREQYMEIFYHILSQLLREPQWPHGMQAKRIVMSEQNQII